MQINDELEVHTGLLEEFDHDLDDTGIRLGRARQRLGRVATGAKEHGEWGPVESLGW
jgi:syntaxin 8